MFDINLFIILKKNKTIHSVVLIENTECLIIRRANGEKIVGSKK